LPEADLELITNAAQHASEIALKYWQTDLAVEHKDGGSPVSEADHAVDDFLRTALLAARPDYGWLSEETEDNDRRLGHDMIFVVDPIDGTRSYIAGQATWAISIAVVRGGQPTAGVVLLPARDKMYSAASGHGAKMNGTPIRTGTISDPDGATVLAPKASLDGRWWSGAVPAVRQHWRPSLAYRFCLVAEARYDAVLTLKDAWEWDIAAGTLIAAEAGARVSDRHGKPLCFNSSDARARGVFAAAPPLHEKLMRRYLGQ